MNEHLKMKQLISAYYDGETDATESAQAEVHIKECVQCRNYFHELKKLSSSLKIWNDEALSFDSEQNVRNKLNQFVPKEGKKMRTRELALSLGTGSIFVIVLAVAIQNVYRSDPGFMVNRRISAPSDDIGAGYSDSNIQGVGYAVGDKKDIRKEADALAKIESTAQYEPYYLKSNYQVQNAPAEVAASKTMPAEQEFFDEDKSEVSNEVRQRGGFQSAAYIDQTAPLPTRTFEGQPAQIMGALRAEKQKHGMVYDRRSDTTVEYFRGGERYYPITPNTEEYGRITENQFLSAEQNPLSTFSIDVDTASYSNVRRFLTQNQLPPADAVRIEELVNYFTYDYPQPGWGQAFSITLESAPCPWNPQNNLVLIGLQGKSLEGQHLPSSNLVFLIDVSGSMGQQNKLPLVKQAFKMMANQLRPQDRVSIVVYAGAAGVVLDSASGRDKWNITSSLDRLNAGGSTAGGQGIELAYSIAKKNFIRNGNNRVILATDGDFNVGVSNNDDLVRLIEEKRNDGIFLSILGFGMGNYKDSKMELLADKGNGTYAYIDNLNEAQKVMVNELGSMLYTIAKDVKIQVEFNPAQVQAYRLVGYENRLMAAEDFNDDTKDAGELGAGHTVTALYEIVPAGSYWNRTPVGNVDPLKYQTKKVRGSSDIMTVKLRHKDPKGSRSRLVSRVLKGNRIGRQYVSDNFLFASAVAEFGQLLRNSQYKGNASYQSVIQRAQSAVGADPYGYRQEFIGLAQKASYLSPHTPNPPVYQPYPVPVPENGQIQFKGSR